MPKPCSYGLCKNVQGPSGCRFFQFPSVDRDPERRRLWAVRCKRLNADGRTWEPNPNSKYVYVCSDHFISGEPWNSKDHPDYAPSVKCRTADSKETQKATQALQRFSMALNRTLNSKRLPTTSAIPNVNTVCTPSSDDNSIQTTCSPMEVDTDDKSSLLNTTNGDTQEYLTVTNSTGQNCNIPNETTVRGEHFMNIAETLVKYREHGFLCDAVLVAKCGRELKAHSALLAAVSPIFLMAIEEKSSSVPYHLYFPEVELDVLEIAVHFVYTGKLLLPEVYSQMDQLPVLFNELSDLGLNLQMLHECEMTFVGSAEQTPNSSISIKVEDADNKTHLKDLVQQLQASCEWPVDKKPSFAESFNEVVIGDVVPNDDGRTSHTMGDSEEISPSTLAKQKGHGNRGQERQKGKPRKAGNKNGKKGRKPSSALVVPTGTVVTNQVMRPAFFILKSVLGEPNTPAAALHSTGTGSWELNNLPFVLLLDQNVGKINTLDSDSHGIREAIVNENGEPNPKPQRDLLPVGFLLDQNVGKSNTLDSDSHGIREAIVNDDGEPNPETQGDILNLVDPSPETQGDILNLVDPSPTEGTPGPNVVEKLADEASIVSTSQALMCEHCLEPHAETFTTEIKLLWHKIKHHWDQCNTCNYCGRRMGSRQSMKTHIKRHLGIYPIKNHKCNDCGLHFLSNDQLKVHSVRHTGEKPYECPYCKKHFSVHGNMERHKLLHTGCRPFLCDICGKGFNRRTRLTNHVTIHHDFECALCSCKQTSKADMEKHAVEVHHLSEVVEFNSIIKNPRTYLCDLCGKNCVSESSLRYHIETHKPVHCGTCGKTFSNSYGLRLHTRLHTGERPFVCDVCQKGFTQKSMLMMHLTIHSGFKPFHCVICSKTFAGKCELETHMNQHTMTRSEKKQFKCGICNSQFTMKASLMVHHKIHTGDSRYKCRICSKQLVNKSSLTIHTRTHTGDKPFSCTVCYQSFTQAQHLSRHKRTHTEEKPFVCEICSKSYKHKIDLRYHFMRFHKIEVSSKSLSENIDIDRKVKVPDTSEANVCIGDELKPELDNRCCMVATSLLD